jgi:hypothetical protein
MLITHTNQKHVGIHKHLHVEVIAIYNIKKYMYLLFFEEFTTILEMWSLKTFSEVLWRLVVCFTWQCFDISQVTPTHLNSRGYITLRKRLNLFSNLPFEIWHSLKWWQHLFTFKWLLRERLKLFANLLFEICYNFINIFGCNQYMKLFNVFNK